VRLGNARDLGVGDEVDGVSTSSVLGQGGIIVVDETSIGVEDNVLENRAEADGVEDFWFFLGGQSNALSLAITGISGYLGIASTFDVEDTVVGPAMFVITDKSTVWIGRQSRLAGS